jgi:asparagine synthase (glutamine-hydrolysing)
MCGIVGVIYQNKKAEPTIVNAMAKSIAHRGPNYQGVWCDGPVGLGHRRLSVIDLSSNGQQPMHDTTGRYCIVFNGEIYNYQELRLSLEGKGYFFHSNTDTEVIMAMYDAYGPTFITKLEGMWAFVLYDKKAHMIYGSRDRFGKKPLYYYQKNGCFAFASQPKALRHVQEIPFGLDQESVELYSMFGYIPEPRSIWKDIKKLPHGTYFLYKVGAKSDIVITEYWNSQDLLQPDESLSTEEIDEGIRKHLEQAVSRRLVADVPVGAFLSGGIDSSSVVAMMSRMKRPADVLHTFSIGFDYKRYDETGYANSMAEKFNTQHHVKILQSGEALDIIHKLPEYYDEPFADSSMIPSFALSQLAREHVTVALSGDGADELWGGYLNYVMFTYLQTIKDIFPKFSYPLIKNSSVLLANVLRSARYNPGLALGLKGLSWLECDYDQLFARLSSLYAYQSPGHGRLFKKYFDLNYQKSPSDALMQSYMNTHLVDDFLVKVDRASMAHGLEVRSPFLDTDFVAFAHRVPALQKISVQGRKYELKGALKRAMAQYLPAKVLGRGKQGFSLPMSEYLVKEWNSLPEDHLMSLAEKNIIPFSKKELFFILKQHRRGVADYSQFLYAMTFFDIWHDYWKS